MDYVSELLAVIHRDGGHYEAEHGRDKACQDAIDIYYFLLMALDDTDEQIK